MFMMIDFDFQGDDDDFVRKHLKSATINYLSTTHDLVINNIDIEEE